MTTENIKSASTVLMDFLDEQAKDEDLDPVSVFAIVSLRKEGKLTKANLLRQLEVARKAKFKNYIAAGD